MKKDPSGVNVQRLAAGQQLAGGRHSAGGRKSHGPVPRGAHRIGGARESASPSGAHGGGIPLTEGLPRLPLPSAVMEKNGVGSNWCRRPEFQARHVVVSGQRGVGGIIVGHRNRHEQIQVPRESVLLPTRIGPLAHASEHRVARR